VQSFECGFFEDGERLARATKIHDPLFELGQLIFLESFAPLTQALGNLHLK
jgi:hypothetical protein